MRRMLFALLTAAAVASSAHAESAPPPPAHPSLLMGVDVMSATVLQQGQSSFSGLGMRVAGISCITNLASGISPHPLSHAEVLATTQAIASQFESLVERWVGGL